MSALSRPHSRRSRWLRRLGLYGGIYLVLVMGAFFGGCADRLLLFPQVGEVMPPVAQAREIPFEQGKLQFWIATPPGNQTPEAFLLVFNGNGDRAEYAVTGAASFWNAHPVEVWAANYPGYGGSTGPAKLNRLGPAGLAAYDALQHHAGDRPIIVFGNSLGTTVALHIAANRNPAGLILMNPPPLRQMILGRFGWWNLWLIAGPVAMAVPSDLNSIANADAAKMPAVFILSLRDSVVPYAWQKRVMTAYTGPIQLVEADADHNDVAPLQTQAELREKIAWLYDQVTTTRGDQ